VSRSKVTGKDELRRELGRSPDRADALALCVFVEPVVEGASEEQRPRQLPPDPYEAQPEGILDPYHEWWRS
jgi:hypothetical protein